MAARERAGRIVALAANIILMLITTAPAGAAWAATLVGTAGPDEIAGTSKAETIYGLDGRDSLSGRGAGDELYGGRGRDILLGRFGPDYIVGGRGQDRLYGGPGMLGGPRKRPDRGCRRSARFDRLWPRQVRPGERR